MDVRRRGIVTVGMSLLLGAAIVTGNPVLAQDATPEGDATQDAGRPAHIHAGTCDELGEVVAPLTNQTLPGGGVGSSALDETGDDAEADDADTDVVTDDAGAGNGNAVETSFSTVPLTLDAIVADEHAINIHLSVDQIDVYIACGEIAGTTDANGALIIGLRELNDSGFVGIAYLSPSATAADSTDVSVFLAQGLAGDSGSGAEDAASDTGDDSSSDDATSDDTTGDDSDSGDDTDTTADDSTDDDSGTGESDDSTDDSEDEDS